MHAQIVADTLGVPYDCIDVNAADTAAVPDSGPTVASRTCMVVGRILQRCAEEMRARLGAPDAARVSAQARPARHHQGVRAAGRDVVGRRQLSGRRLRQLRLGLRRRRARGRSRHLGGAADRVSHGARDRQGDSSDARDRPDRRRQRAGARLRAARGRRDARRPDGERLAHQLHHPDDARHAGDARS